MPSRQPPHPLNTCPALLVASGDKSERGLSARPGCAQASGPGGSFPGVSMQRNVPCFSPQACGVILSWYIGQRTGYSSHPGSAHLFSLSSSPFSKNIVFFVLFFNPSPTPSFFQQMLTTHQFSVLGLMLQGEWADFTHRETAASWRDWCHQCPRHSLTHWSWEGYLEAVVTKGALMHE